MTDYTAVRIGALAIILAVALAFVWAIDEDPKPPVRERYPTWTTYQLDLDPPPTTSLDPDAVLNAIEEAECVERARRAGMAGFGCQLGP